MAEFLASCPMCLRANNQRENTRAYLFLCAQGCFKPGVSGLARLTFIRKHRLDLGGARPSQGLKEGWGGDEAETRWEARELFSLQAPPSWWGIIGRYRRVGSEPPAASLKPS